jgi:hypothetical protein
MRPISILFSVALFAACGVSPTANPTTYQDFAIAQSQTQCEAAFRCCASKCSAGIDNTFNKAFKATQKLIDAGKLTFDANAGSKCLDSYRARYQDCELAVINQPSLTPVCSQVLVGKLSLGQACDPTVTNLCVSGTYCDQTLASPVCSSYLADSAPCGTGGKCAATSYCDVAGSMTCKPYPKSGQACGGLAVCDSTSTKLVCLPSMLCGPPAADGGACAMNAHCMSGNCGTATPRTCVPSATPPSTVRDSLCP